MVKLNCLIVEDEPLAADVIKDYIMQVSYLHLEGICTDAMYAMEFLVNNDIDLIFLDIHLPKIKGLDFIKTLHQTPHIIITTAYHQYALDGFNLNVVDYLLKPIEFSRFLQAINKIPSSIETRDGHQSQQSNQPRPYQFVKTNKVNKKIYLDEVSHVESVREYLHIHTSHDITKVRGQMSDIPLLLESLVMIRVHRSFAITKEHITSYSANKISIGKFEIPIGRSYKEYVLNLLK